MPKEFSIALRLVVLVRLLQKKDGKTGEIAVTVQTASNITAKYPNILIDSTEQHPIEIEGVINGATHPAQRICFQLVN